MHILYNFKSFRFVIVYDPGCDLSWWVVNMLPENNVYSATIGLSDLKMSTSCSWWYCSVVLYSDFLLVPIMALSISPLSFVFVVHILRIYCLVCTFRIAMSSWWIGPFIFSSFLFSLIFIIVKSTLIQPFYFSFDYCMGIYFILVPSF